MKKIENQDDLSLIPFSFDTTILVLLISAYSYGCTYYYEKGFCQSFSIPIRYSSIDANTLLPFWTTSLIVALFIFSMIYTYFRLSAAKKRLADIFGINISLVVLIVAMYYIGPITTFLYIIFIVLFFVVNAMYLMVTRRNNRRNTDQKKLSLAEKRAMLGTVRAYFFGFISITAFCTLMFSESIGRGTALRTTSFFVLKADSQIVVLRNYNDRLLCRRLNLKTNKLENSVIIMPLGSAPSVELREKELGRLTDYKLALQIWQPLN